jgi:hypothetical protein
MKDDSRTGGVNASRTRESCGLATVSPALGYLGLLTAAATIPAVVVENTFAWERTEYAAQTCPFLTFGLAVAGILCGLEAKATMAGVPWSLRSRVTSTSGIQLGLICLFALQLNLAAIPHFARAHDARPTSACNATLYQVERARHQWLRKKKRTASETLRWDDLVGPGKTFAREPLCPANGTYSLGGATSKPTCTVPGHDLR